MEIVKVNAASGVGGGEVEQRKPLTYEIGPVEIHLQCVADAFPFLAVKTVINEALSVLSRKSQTVRRYIRSQSIGMLSISIPFESSLHEARCIITWFCRFHALHPHIRIGFEKPRCRRGHRRACWLSR